MPVPGDNLDTHEARRDSLREPGMSLLIGVRPGVADERSTVSDVLERSVLVFARQHLECRDVLVGVHACLENDTRDGADFTSVDGQVLAGDVLSRKPAAAAVEHAREVARARLVVVQ